MMSDLIEARTYLFAALDRYADAVEQHRPVTVAQARVREALAKINRLERQPAQ